MVDSRARFHTDTTGGPHLLTQMTSLHEERLDRVCNTLRATGARTVLDLGCGSGSLLSLLVREPRFTQLVGLDQSGISLSLARTILATTLEKGTPEVTLINGSYQEPDLRLTGFDAAAMVETIEHVPPHALSTVEQTVFGHYRPGSLFMTTPNSEYNPLLGLAPGEFREEDHKFEWTRAKFRQWARGVATRNGYRVKFGGIGEEDPELGPPTQTALFTLSERQ